MQRMVQINQSLINHSYKLKLLFSDGSDPNDVNIYWKKVNVILNTTLESSQILNKQTKALRKKLKILDNSLYFKKIESKESGLYNCYLNTSSPDYDSTVTLQHETFSYFIHVYNVTTQTVNGTYTEWNYYEDYVYKANEKMIQSIPLINQMFRPSLIVHWSAWGNCLCGKYTYDTRSYRLAYCCTKIFHGLILPCQSSILKDISPEIAKILGNIMNFKEYCRCMEDCLPGNNIFVLTETNLYRLLLKSHFRTRGGFQTSNYSLLTGVIPSRT